MAAQPPAFGGGQAFKPGAGLFGATDGTSIWLFSVNTDAANSILFTRFNGTSWTPWATVPGTGSGTQSRNFISGSPRVGNNQVGLIWTEGTTNFDVVTASLNTDTTIPTVSMTAPADGAIVSGTAVAVSATASDDLGVVGVQFKLDGADLGAEDTSSPYTTTWNADAATNGPHTLTAVARDAANNTTTATAVTVTVAASSGNKVTPVITWPVPASITYGTALSATQLNATTTVPGTFVYAPPAATVLAAGAGQSLR